MRIKVVGRDPESVPLFDNMQDTVQYSTAVSPECNALHPRLAEVSQSQDPRELAADKATAKQLSFSEDEFLRNMSFNKAKGKASKVLNKPSDIDLQLNQNELMEIKRMIKEQDPTCCFPNLEGFGQTIINTVIYKHACIVTSRLGPIATASPPAKRIKNQETPTTNGGS
ncbi:uncharacterized protein FSUBG_6160 [Fusarium subglutinans]|uniref:Uncharacterized protein n=1 Tax=Gibberella subglutinans TaxID=42677 RepID=A0A8H5PZQ3_GIBSU|nr:uncharacterized protein FSUBG_6160 [Fusarium subglutinans]KAF5606326.1 hypothetical protein FSUBG_6160 [Fusarium subglutinans]